MNMSVVFSLRLMNISNSVLNLGPLSQLDKPQINLQRWNIGLSKFSFFFSEIFLLTLVICENEACVIIILFHFIKMHASQCQVQI